MAGKEALVTQIKELQRTDPNAKQAWTDFSDTQLNGARDPNRQDEAVLANFLTLYSTGGLSSIQQQAAAYRAAPPTPMDKIKLLQKSDPLARQAWTDYCDAMLGGIKDPNRHDPNTINQFLQLYQTGGAPAVQQAARAWGGGNGKGMGKGGGTLTDLCSFIKAGQKASPEHFRTAWVTYCTVYGGGRCDPGRHDESFVSGFVEYIGELANHGLTALAQQAGIQVDTAEVGQKRKHGWDDPSAKRSASSIAPSNDPMIIQLAERVKNAQRQNPATKEAWIMYCNQTAGGVKDPLRHDAGSLQTFLATNGV
eukprot:gb/GFBE01011869.1/.p1 GENE.gb/GFBE01011869.1/~~gb/GFBE01011869.1/.p1  ORF type:complete len:309 (+),score=83.87 gb/GFBE01011869.1/:1-927(+)